MACPCYSLGNNQISIQPGSDAQIGILIFLKDFVDFCQCLNNLVQRLAVFIREYLFRTAVIAGFQLFNDERAHLVKLPVRIV